MVPFPMTLRDHQPRFQGHGVTTDALDVLCAQLTSDLFAIAKFLVLLKCAVFTLHGARNVLQITSITNTITIMTKK